MTTPVGIIGFFRNRWATRLTDTATVVRRTGSSFNTTSGVETFTTTTVYSGSALYRPGIRRDVEFAEQRADLMRGALYIPHTAATVQPGDLVTVTSTTDSSLAGVTHVVRGVRRDTYNTVRRLDLEENQDGP